MHLNFGAHYAENIWALKNAIDNRRFNDVKPRVHGNGFIQLDLGTDEQAEFPGDIRMHVWGDPRIPKQDTPSTIHDHIFSFESTIIVGKLCNLTYDATYVSGSHPMANYKVYEAFVREGQDTGLEFVDRYMYALPQSFEIICAEPGYEKIYHMAAGEYHESIADRPAITIMQKVGKPRTDIKPHVLVPLGKEPNNEFRRNGFDEKLLWNIIYDTINRADA